MTKKRTRKAYAVNHTPVDFDETVDVVVEPATMAEPDLPVSAGIEDAVIAPPEPTPEPLDAGEVILDIKEQSTIHDGVYVHHVREASDGRWIYAPVHNRG